MDEVLFYAKAEELKQTETSLTFLPFILPFKGILSLPKMDLIVIKNVKDGAQKIRFADIKIGQRSSAKNWKGKSTFAHFRMGRLDALTNSALQGFRLEGMTSAPDILTSMDSSAGVKELSRKAKRFQTQRLTGWKIMEFFSLVPASATEAAVIQFNILMGIKDRLHEYYEAISKCSVPQKWISSSIGLSFDMDRFLKDVRQGRTDKEPVRLDGNREISMCIFDWGRSELMTAEVWPTLSAKDQQDRERYWKEYVTCVENLLTETRKLLSAKYSNPGPKYVVIEVWDYDSVKSNDFIGQAVLPLAESGSLEVPLKSKNGETVVGASGKTSQLKIAIRSVTHQVVGEALRQAWQVSVVRASDLPKKDWFAYSDPLAIVQLVEDIPHSSGIIELGSGSQRTRVIPQCLDPEWNDTFVFLDIDLKGYV